MFTKAGILFGLMLLAVRPAAAAMADYIPAFEINLEEDELPTMSELEAFFQSQEGIYDTHYTSTFDVGEVFDRDFYGRIATYGSNEKRLKGENEDAILEMLNSIPRAMYPYIGPMLFTIPNMSEKVLNLPGIRETKNKFPTRIAPQLKGIDDLEFLSPFLYYLLMPEVWPENVTMPEMPRRIPAHPKVAYDKDFYQAIKKLVPPEHYMTNVPQAKKIGRSDLRTVNPEKNSLLTSTDVKAFIGTLDGIREWTGANRYRLSRVTTMLLSYEANRPDNILLVPGLKDLVNPCQRLVQKATIMGQERELAMIAAKQGFTLNEWAYTCDKTIKAYRLSKISSGMAMAIRGYQSGLHDDDIRKLSPRSQQSRYSTMQAIVEMYKAPLNDVREVRKNRTELTEKWRKSDFKLGDIPISRLD